jgi:hypothetical protein
MLVGPPGAPIRPPGGGVAMYRRPEPRRGRRCRGPGLCEDEEFQGVYRETLLLCNSGFGRWVVTC